MYRSFIAACCFLFFAVASAQPPSPVQVPILDPNPASPPVAQLSAEEKQLYRLAPPDIITIEVIHLMPKAPYRLRMFDIITVDVMGTPQDDPISGFFAIEPGGIIQLGSTYGSVKVEKLSVEEAQEAIRWHLSMSDANPTGQLTEPIVSVELVRLGAVQKIVGKHTIGPDGYITLGPWMSPLHGRVYVEGLTIDECQGAIEFYLSKLFENPQVSVDIFACNNKAYSLVLQPQTIGERVLRFPHTGNETVLDALANAVPPDFIGRVWVVRPVDNSNKPVIMPVDWVDIIAYGKFDTNYQLLSGDRVFVDSRSTVVQDKRPTVARPRFLPRRITAIGNRMTPMIFR